MKILTQNMWINHVTFKTSTEDKKQRIHDMISHLPNYDVVTFQEVFAHKIFASLDFKQLLTEESKKHGFNYVAQCREPPSYLSQDAGLMILSKYPIVETEFVSFSSYSWFDMVVDKGFLYAQIQQSPTQKLHLITTHLDAHNREVKLSQVKQVSNYVTTKLKSCMNSEPIVITGDWNIDAINSKDLYSSFLNEFPGMKNVFNEEPFPVTHMDSRACLDHVLVNQFDKLVPVVSNDENIYRVEALKGTGDRSNERISDHFGVFINIEL
jgi:endonuclease/exonuclease/phosphatase family metal-dependent hydrolase